MDSKNIFESFFSILDNGIDEKLGIKRSVFDAIKWVDRNYRKNELSHEPGGADVIVEYKSNIILGYDWIKYPSRYIKRIVDKDIKSIHVSYDGLSEEKQLHELKTRIKTIYARKYTIEDKDIIPFDNVWNSETSLELPWEKLEKYDFRS